VLQNVAAYNQIELSGGFQRVKRISQFLNASNAVSIIVDVETGFADANKFLHQPPIASSVIENVLYITYVDLVGDLFIKRTCPLQFDGRIGRISAVILTELLQESVLGVHITSFRTRFVSNKPTAGAEDAGKFDFISLGEPSGKKDRKSFGVICV